MEETKKESASSEAQPTASKDDVEKNKGMAILAYFIFFIPLLTDAKNSPFAKYHVKQSIIILIASIVVNIVGSVIPFLGWFLILPVGAILVFVLWIMGLMNAINGKMKPVPLIGTWGEQWFKF